MRTWSVVRSFADHLFRRPCWFERDGRHVVSVHGHSLFEGALAGAIILAACIGMLAVMP